MIDKTNDTRKLRHVVIGVGAGIFATHRTALDHPATDLVGVADLNVEVGQALADELGCSFFADHKQMLAETKPDVATIVTPHPFHAPLAIDCFEAGCHVLVEKPIAVEVAEADAMLSAAQKAGRLLVVNFQQRFRPEVQAAYKLIQEGHLGELQYVSMAVTSLRTKAYYDFAGWRGTWQGEGGGLIMNQAPHDLDMLCYLAGRPNRVFAWTPTQLHNIETEDTATAIMTWPNGATGTLHSSTAQAGLPQRFEMIGTGGALRINRGQLSFDRNDTDVRDYIQNSQEKYRPPVSSPEEISLVESAGNHQAVYDNLRAAIFSGESLVSDGDSATMSLELANAMILSNYTGSQVELPLNRQQYHALLTDLKAGNRP